MKNSENSVRQPVIQLLLTIFAILAAIGALLRLADVEIAKRVDQTTLLYLAVAGALLLLRDVKSLAFGDYKVEFDRKLDELEVKVDDAQAAAVGGRSSPESSPSTTRSLDKMSGTVPTPGTVKDDPWKGQFGGTPVSGTRKLDADVTSITNELFRVRLTVQSTNPRRDPIRGSVRFFLHPSFRNDRPVVTVGPRGIAELTLISWGAFTVGAIADDGRTKLELDLAELPSAPQDFKAR